MTLTENGKKYIATTFGNVSKCYVASGINWSYTGTDSQTYNESGGTAQIVSRLIMTSLVQSVTYNEHNYTYAALKTANDNTDIALGDVQWIAQNDGAPTGEAQYCSTALSTGSISCTTTPSGASVYLDGVSQGVVTPVTLTNVSAGSHTVTFALSGYNACPVTVTVAAGVTATASCTLTSAPPQIVTGDIMLLIKVKINYIYTITTSIIPDNVTDVITGATEIVIGNGDNK